MDMKTLLPILIPLVIVIPLLLLRNRAPRRLRPEGLWIMPLLIVVAIGWGIYAQTYMTYPGHVPTPLDSAGFAILGVGLVLGAVFGWWRGKMTEIDRNPAGELFARQSPLGLILIVAVLLLRRVLEAAIEANASSLHLSAIAVTDGFMLFVVGMIVTQRVEMFVRARRIQAGRPDAATVDVPSDPG